MIDFLSPVVGDFGLPDRVAVASERGVKDHPVARVWIRATLTLDTRPCEHWVG